MTKPSPDRDHAPLSERQGGSESGFHPDLTRDFETTDPARDSTVNCPPASLSSLTVGRRFGDYELIEEIAHGGMGVVFKARQSSLNRIVAVKMIRTGSLASDDEVRRFRVEAEAAARLRHPHIVAIHEVGEHDGIHYFSMDFIEGRSLAALVQASPLAPQRAVEYMAKVAEATDYAHRQGLLHRDLKPSNILVDEADQPLVTDFGLARPLVEDSRLTASGAVLGTPSYMPPEQAAGDGTKLGPASDVYALGATLYELLTGRPPFRAATPIETLRQVIESEPVAPRQLNPAIARDLETITLKCLQKEANRRYATALELQEDLRRYVNGEPIRARSVGAIERVWRWTRRNPRVAGLVAGIMASLLTATVTLAIAVVRISAANQAAHAAKEQAETDRTAAEQARDAAHDERDRFESISSFLMHDMLGSVDPLAAQGREITVKEVLQNAAARVDTAFHGRPELEVALRHTIGNVYRSLGEFDEAELHLEKAIEIGRQAFGMDTPDTVRSIIALSMLRVRQGRADDAVNLARQAMDRLPQHRGEADEDMLAAMDIISSVLRDQGNLIEAEPILRKALDICRRVRGAEDRQTLILSGELALLLCDQGRIAESNEMLRELVDVAQRVLGPKHLDTLSAMNNLGLGLIHLGDDEQAEKLLREALDLRIAVQGPEHIDTLGTMGNLVLALGKQGKVAEAEVHARNAIEVTQQVLGPDHPDTSIAIWRLGDLLRQHGRRDEAEPLIRQALELSRRSMGPSHPQTLAVEATLAILLKDQGKLAEAELMLRRSLQQHIDSLGPENLNTIAMQFALGDVLRKQEKWLEAEAVSRTAWEAHRRVLGPQHSATLQCLSGLAETLTQTDRPAEAESMLRECLSMQRETLPPGSAMIARSQLLLGLSVKAQGRMAEAERLLLDSYDMLHNAQGASRRERENAIARIIELYEAWGKPEQVAEWRKKLSN